MIVKRLLAYIAMKSSHHVVSRRRRPNFVAEKTWVLYTVAVKLVSVYLNRESLNLDVVTDIQKLLQALGVS